MARILIIDDDDSFRVLLEQWLAAAGHVTVGAADGLEGLRMFRTDPAEIVLLDMMMPHYGLSALRVLREQFPDARVIAMTGGPGRRLGHARDLGARATLSKPFSPQELADAIAVALAPPAVQS